jgi:hypothetical protein
MTVADATGFFSLDSELSLELLVSSVDSSLEFREVSFESVLESSDELPESEFESPESEFESPEFESPESELPESEFESEPPESEASAPECSTALSGLGPLAPGV